MSANGHDEKTVSDLAVREVPSRDLEDRVVAALCKEGLMETRHQRNRTAFGALAAGVGAIALFAGGWGSAQWATAQTASPQASSTVQPAAPPTHALLLYDTASYRPAATPAEHQARVREYTAWARDHASGPGARVVGGDELLGTVGTHGGAAAGGDLAGFFLVRAGSADEAMKLAGDCPHLKHGGSVVVRAVGA
jgi:hypothetical protein